jgi:hypothetical protein|tara:strand:- start:1553 stop:1780 length:228 start_codon:yes stop_codon:yes gene_type:complete
MNRVATATVKYTEAEILLLINSLEMTISTKVPCVINGQWKTPYEKLQKDLKRIKRELIDFKHKKSLEPENKDKSA